MISEEDAQLLRSEGLFVDRSRKDCRKWAVCVDLSYCSQIWRSQSRFGASRVVDMFQDDDGPLIPLEDQIRVIAHLIRLQRENPECAWDDILEKTEPEIHSLLVLLGAEA